MEFMRKILLGFMTLLMLTPVMTCAMAFCPMQSAHAGEQKPCHQSKDSKKDGPMLALDCMGVNLFQQDAQADVPQPQASVDIIHFAWADLTAGYNFQPTAVHFIRGPPFDTERPQSQPSIILTTQRFRI